MRLQQEEENIQQAKVALEQQRQQILARHASFGLPLTEVGQEKVTVSTQNWNSFTIIRPRTFPNICFVEILPRRRRICWLPLNP